MKKEEIILLCAVTAIIIVIAIKKKKTVVKPGDKSEDIAGMQNVFTKVSNINFTNKGAYDSQTHEAVKYLLTGSPVLINEQKGYLCKDFVHSLAIMSQKSSNSIK